MVSYNFIPPMLHKRKIILINHPTSVEEHFSRRKVFKMNATSKAEMGDNFFPEGTQRVYVSLVPKPIRHGALCFIC